jgi:4-amino-4-deoxy-L-arabinose transferase-like glycosyltransferase
MDQAILRRTQAIESKSPIAGRLWLLLIALLLFRLALAAVVQLVPDEAFYWTWTRHLAGGFFDHPPMIAYLMWLSTRVLGDTELGVRFFAVVLPFAGVALLLLTAHRLIPDGRSVKTTAAILLTSPLLAGLATIFTPDTPAVFFSICAMVCVLVVVSDAWDDGIGRHKIALWMAFGVFCGLALLSKYTTILLPAAVFWAMLTSREGRHHLCRPWIYLSGLVALAVFSPVILWNYTHDWASFRFQLRHGLESTPESSWKTFGLFVGGQVLLWTPVLFVLGLVVLISYWRRYNKIGLPMKILLWSSSLPLVFFGYAATRAKGEINWPDGAYFPLTLLTTAFVCEIPDDLRMRWATRGCIIAFAGLTAIHVPWLWARMGVSKANEVFGWRELGRQLDTLIVDDTPLFCSRHQDSGEAAFYMSRQPEVGSLPGGRPTSFDYYPIRPDFASLPKLWVMGMPKGSVSNFCKQFGLEKKREELVRIDVPVRIRERRLILLERPAPAITSRD